MKTKYNELFELHKKVTGAGFVQILKKDSLPEFIMRVQADKDISLEEKSLIIVLANTGCRISEAVESLHKRDFSGEYLTLTVLKKRKESSRQAKIHFGYETVAELLTHRKPQEFLFQNIDRHQALRLMKRVFGEQMSNHAFRHSLISTLALKNWSVLRISKAMNINVNTVSLYANLNQKNELDRMFEINNDNSVTDFKKAA